MDHGRVARVMFAHFIAALGHNPVVTDDDMMFSEACPRPGSSGRTLCLLSFAVCPEVQGRGIGKGAVMSYLQLIRMSQVADRVALLCKRVRKKNHI